MPGSIPSTPGTRAARLAAMTTDSPYRGSAPAPSVQVVVTTGPDVPGFRITQVLAVIHGVALRPAGGADAGA